MPELMLVVLLFRDYCSYCFYLYSNMNNNHSIATPDSHCTNAIAAMLQVLPVRKSSGRPSLGMDLCVIFDTNLPVSG